MSISIRYNAPITLTFSLACVGIFLLSEMIPALRTEFFVLHGYWNWSDPLDYLRLFTYTLGHANKEHLIGNISVFLLIAPIMEEKYGSKDIAVMMVMTALITAIFQVLLFDTDLLGASGLLFMFIILASFADARKGSIPLTFILVLLFYVGKEVAGALSNDNVSQYAHIAGGLLGALFGFAIETNQNQANRA